MYLKLPKIGTEQEAIQAASHHFEHGEHPNHGKKSLILHREIAANYATTEEFIADMEWTPAKAKAVLENNVTPHTMEIFKMADLLHIKDRDAFMRSFF